MKISWWGVGRRCGHLDLKDIFFRKLMARSRPSTQNWTPSMSGQNTSLLTTQYTLSAHHTVHTICSPHSTHYLLTAQYTLFAHHTVHTICSPHSTHYLLTTQYTLSAHHTVHTLCSPHSTHYLLTTQYTLSAHHTVHTICSPHSTHSLLTTQYTLSSARKSFCTNIMVTTSK